MKSILDTVRSTTGLTRFADVIDAAGLAESLGWGGPYTIFAPTDGAFAVLPPDTIDRLSKDRPAILQVLLYHALEGRLMFEEMSAMKELRTVEGTSLTVRRAAFGPLIDGSRILAPDVECSNGVLHVIDHVLFPGLMMIRNNAHRAWE